VLEPSPLPPASQREFGLVNPAIFFGRGIGLEFAPDSDCRVRDGVGKRFGIRRRDSTEEGGRSPGGLRSPNRIRVAKRKIGASWRNLLLSRGFSRALGSEATCSDLTAFERSPYGYLGVGLSSALHRFPLLIGPF